MSRLKTILPAHGTRNNASNFSTSIPSISYPSSSEGRADVRKNMEEKKPKRKRMIQGKVAVIACSECRRTRSRCEGEAPQACVRCRERGARCIYQPHTKIQKDEILNDLEQERSKSESLLQQNNEFLTIFQAISEDSRCREIVQRLHQRQGFRSIDELLKSAGMLQNLPERRNSDASHMEEPVKNLAQILGVSPIGSVAQNPSKSSWTRVTGNTWFLDHLVRLYLAHVHPHCPLFDELTFVQRYRSNEESACFKSLLNAICAMACNALDRRRHIITERHNTDLARVQDAFSAEAGFWIDPLEPPKIMTAQALAIMYLVELNRGQARSANAHLKHAMDCLKILDSEVGHMVDFDYSRWSISCLESTSCILSPYDLHSPQSEKTSTLMDLRRELLKRFPKEAEHSLNNPIEIYSLSIVVADFETKLGQLVNEMVSLYKGWAGQVTLNAIETLSKALTHLLEIFSTDLRECNTHQSQLDTRLVRIKFYSMASSLWSPPAFIAQQQQNDNMLDHCLFHLLNNARQGVSLARELLREQSCAFIPPQHTMCIINICDTVARWTKEPEERFEAMHTCFKILDRNTMNQKLCLSLQKLFRNELAKFIESETIEAIEQQYEIPTAITLEEVLDSPIDLPYTAKLPIISKWLSEDTQWQTAKTWPSSLSERRASTSGAQAMSVEDMCN